VDVTISVTIVLITPRLDFSPTAPWLTSTGLVLSILGLDAPFFAGGLYGSGLIGMTRIFLPYLLVTPQTMEPSADIPLLITFT
jgi:hypothetical protein